jgi:hypothetical protein
MILPFDEWRPDLAPLSQGMEQCLNVLPAADGYVPAPVPVFRGPGGLRGLTSCVLVVTSGDGVTVPLAFTVVGAFRAQATGWLDVSRTPDDYEPPLEAWSATQYGDAVFAVNGRDPVGILPLGAGAFRDIADAPFGLSANYIAVVGDFLVLASTTASGANERHHARVWWSGRGRPERFSPDLATQAGFVDRPGIGRIRGLTGGEFGLILGEEGLDRCDYSGPPAVFQFRNLETDIGCELSRSVVQAGTKTAWWSRRGWRMSSGGPSQGIGVGKVDSFTRSRIDFDRGHLMTATALLREDCFVWAFVSRNNTTGRPDEALAYNWTLDRWSRIEMEVDCLGRLAVPSLFTDDPGLAQIYGPSTDDSDLLTDSAGGERPFAAAVTNGSLFVLQPKPGLAAQLTTTEANINPGGRALLSRVRPLVHGVSDDTWLYTQTRDDQRSESLHTKGPLQPERDGSFSTHAVGRYHRLRLHVRSPWSKAQGIEVADYAVARAGRR